MELREICTHGSALGERPRPAPCYTRKELRRSRCGVTAFSTSGRRGSGLLGRRLASLRAPVTSTVLKIRLRFCSCATSLWFEESGLAARPEAVDETAAFLRGLVRQRAATVCARSVFALLGMNF